MGFAASFHRQPRRNDGEEASACAAENRKRENHRLDSKEEMEICMACACAAQNLSPFELERGGDKTPPFELERGGGRARHEDKACACAATLSRHGTSLGSERRDGLMCATEVLRVLSVRVFFFTFRACESNAIPLLFCG